MIKLGAHLLRVGGVTEQDAPRGGDADQWWASAYCVPGLGSDFRHKEKGKERGRGRENTSVMLFSWYHCFTTLKKYLLCDQFTLNII